MYYRRQGEPQEMYGNNSVSSSAVNTYLLQRRSFLF